VLSFERGASVLNFSCTGLASEFDSCLPSKYYGCTDKAFFPVDDGIYYIGKRNDQKQFPLQFYRFSTETSELLTNIEGTVGQGLSVCPDRKEILFAKAAAFGFNLMMIENFR